MFTVGNYVTVCLAHFVKPGEIIGTCARTNHSELQDLCSTHSGITAHTAGTCLLWLKKKLTSNGIMITIKYIYIYILHISFSINIHGVLMC